MIKSVTLNNFKSIKKNVAKLPSFGAIVGKNAVGKTNLIQSIRFVKSLVQANTTSEAQKRISLIPNELFNFTDTNTEFGIDILVESSKEETYLLSVRIGLMNGTIKPPILTVTNEKLVKVVGQNMEVIYTRQKNEIKDKNGSAIPLAVDQDKLGIALFKNPDTDIVKEIFVNTSIPEFKELSNIDSLGIGVEDLASNNLADILVNLRHNNPEAYNKFLAIIKKLMPYFTSFTEIQAQSTTDPSIKGRFLIVLEEINLKDNLSMQSISAGDIRTLYLIASALNMPDHSTIIIEEIENGIHPKRINDLIDHLDTISNIKSMQIIFTTHSPLVINRLPPAKILFVEKSQEHGTTFELLSETKQILDIKELLEHGGKITDYLNVNNP